MRPVPVRLLRAFCLVLAFTTMSANAQDAPARCRDTGENAADRLLRATFDQPAERPATVPQPATETAQPDKPPGTIEAGTRVRRLVAAREPSARLSGSSVQVFLDLERTDPPWPKVELSGAARTRDHQPGAAPNGPSGQPVDELLLYGRSPIFAQLRQQNGQRGIVELDFPRRAGTSVQESWFLIVALCDADSNRVFAYGAVEVQVHSLAFSAWISAGLVALIYGLLVWVSLQVNGDRLRRAALLIFGRAGPPRGWRLAQASSPVFLSQDATGVASLARLQLLAFTLAVVFVYTYVFARTGELAALSEDVLKLLGIAVLGSSFARIVGDSGSVTPENRIWLKGKGLVVTRDDRLPQVAQLVCADGVVDVARVQAIVFSVLTVIALLWKGPRDLGGFEISQETLYLLGLSQIAYVAGKAIPAENVRRLNAEVGAMRAAERELTAATARQAALAAGAPAEVARGAEDLVTARNNWNAALTAAEETLTGVYGTSFDAERLRGMRV